MDFSFDLNVKAMYRVVRAVLPGHDRARRRVNRLHRLVASSVKGVPARCAYGASKGGGDRARKSVAADHRAEGALQRHLPRHRAVAFARRRIAARGGGPEVRQAFIDRQPMGRLGTAAEMAALALHLAGDESAFTTGQTFIADGGMTL